MMYITRRKVIPEGSFRMHGTIVSIEIIEMSVKIINNDHQSNYFSHVSIKR